MSASHSYSLTGISTFPASLLHSFFLSFFPAGESGIDVFAREADRRNICIAIAEKVPSNADEKTFSEVGDESRVTTLITGEATPFVPKLHSR